MKGFRLISIILNNSEDFDEGTFDFSKQKSNLSKQKGPYTTLIIGPNGTGKSRLLRIILDVFNDLYNFKKQGTAEYRFKHYYKLIYSIDKDVFKIENGRTLILKKNNKRVQDLSDITLPQKAIAAAYSSYDRFSPKSVSRPSFYNNRRKTRYDNDFYEYLGLKSERNYTFSGAYINKSIDLITEALAAEGFNKEVEHVFQVLGFLPKITITYRASKSQELLSGNLTLNRFQKIISNSSYEEIGFNFNQYNKLKDMSEVYLREIIDAFNATANDFGPKLQLPLELVFDAGNSHSSFRRKYKNIALLRSLNFIHPKEIIVYKRIKRNPEGAPIDIKNMSSGEIQILTSMLALCSIVKDNSLVLIDEPEISLHPNWQLQYIDILNKVFKISTSCHFLIASHSHFLVSDLKQSSSILSLKMNKKLEVIPEFLDYATEGWSTENVLYNVFDVATVRNHYFEMDLRKLLHLISLKSSNKTSIRNYIEKFEKFNIHKNDPLNIIIGDAKKYLNEN